MRRKGNKDFKIMLLKIQEIILASLMRTQTDTMTASMTVGMRAMTAILLNEFPSRAHARKRYI